MHLNKFTSMSLSAFLDTFQLRRNVVPPHNSSHYENKNVETEEQSPNSNCQCQSAQAKEYKEKLQKLFEEKAIITKEIRDLQSEKQTLQCQPVSMLRNGSIKSSVNGQIDEGKLAELTDATNQIEKKLKDKNVEIESVIDEIKKNGFYESLSVYINNLELTDLVSKYENRIQVLEQALEKSNSCTQTHISAIKRNDDDFDDLNAQLTEIVAMLSSLQEEYSEKEEECLRLHEQLKQVSASHRNEISIKSCEIGQSIEDTPNGHQNLTVATLDNFSHLVSTFHHDLNISEPGTESTERHEESFPLSSDPQDLVCQTEKLSCTLRSDKRAPLTTSSSTTLSHPKSRKAKLKNGANNKAAKITNNNLLSSKALRSSAPQGQSVCHKFPNKDSEKKFKNGASSPGRVRKREFRCPVNGCNKVFSHTRNLKKHNRVHTGERPFRCLVSGCNRAFADSCNLKKHSRVHTGERPFKCSVSGCNKAFAQSAGLQRHKKVHTGERPFKCSVTGCNKAFAQSVGLQRHSRVHTGERPFKCSASGCNKAFSHAISLQRHKKIHTGEQPSKCPVSGRNKAFTESTGLKRHSGLHAGDRIFRYFKMGQISKKASTQSARL